MRAGLPYMIRVIGAIPPCRDHRVSRIATDSSITATPLTTALLGMQVSQMVRTHWPGVRGVPRLRAARTAMVRCEPLVVEPLAHVACARVEKPIHSSHTPRVRLSHVRPTTQNRPSEYNHCLTRYTCHNAPWSTVAHAPLSCKINASSYGTDHAL